MKRLFMLCLLVCINVAGLLAQNVVNLSGTTVGAPTAIFPGFGSTSGSCSLGAASEPYRTFRFTCSATGTITANITNPISVMAGTDDTGLFWYQTNFTASAGCTNFRAIGNDPVGSGLSFSATGGVTYILSVVGLFGSADAFALTLTGPIGSMVVLPVELISFNGKTEKGVNNLKWATATESNNSGFSVERSADGETFTSIGFVKGGGTTQKQQNYQMMDAKPLSGINYYRLKQVDNDGKFTYSNTITLVVEKGTETLRIYPNPTHKEITVAYPLSTKATISLFSAAGQLMKQMTTESDLTTVNLELLPVGMYFLKMQTESNTFVQKFVKE